MPGRETLSLVAAVDWTPILVAVITLIGTLTSASISAMVLWHIRTPSGTRIGKQVEDVNHTTIVNHHRIAELARRLHALDDESET